MRHVFEVALGERVVVLRDGLPVRALEPGRHVLWGWGRYRTLHFHLHDLMIDTKPEILAMLPSGWFNEVSLGTHERGVLYRDGKPVVWLRPGTHRYWTLETGVEVAVFSVDEAMPPLTDELQAVIPRGEYIDVTILAHERGVLYRQGSIEDLVGPGRYTMWTYPASQVAIAKVDMRRQELTLASQELMTRDKVTLRLNLSAAYVVSDPLRMAQRVPAPRDPVYLMVQLAAREYVASVTLDELLEGREALNAYLAQATAAPAEDIGLRIETLGVKDVVLPGEMKDLMNRVIAAEKEAAANVILRREETAATRSLANTAKVMADNPVLLRLKELEAVKEIAGQVNEVRLVVGSDGLEKLIPAGLLRGDR